MSNNYDPAKTPCDPVFYPCRDCQMCIAGPGGNKQLIENNEKGILETELMKVAGTLKTAELSASHPRTGIY